MSTIKTINLQHPSSSTVNVTLDNSGGVAVPSLTVNSVPVLAGPAFAASDTATTSTAAVATKIVFDTEIFDTANAFDGTQFQPTVAGYYLFTLRVANGVNTNAGSITCAFYKNGSVISNAGAITYYGAGFGAAVTSSVIVYLNGSTDYMEFYGTNASNANLGAAYVSAALVRAA